jgi:basic amino acid/polyamine antiporter, APA family
MADPAGAPPAAVEPPHLRRRLGLLESTALNMANMVGVGPFITIPLIMKEMPGAQVILGWACGLILAIADSMMWCELGAALPGSGGTYHYLREVFRGRPLGRLLPFLFIWQFIFSGPLEVASGCIGFAGYFEVLWPASWGPLTATGGKVVASLVAVLAVALLYRKIGSIGKLTIALWAGMLLSVGVAIFTAARQFDPARAFALPAEGIKFNADFAWSFGAALGIAMYDFLGYYDICYLGDEVREPARTIPRAVVISVIVVAGIYTFMNIGIIGVIPLDQVIGSQHIGTDLVKTVWKSDLLAGGFAVLILWTAMASVFALLLGYSRIPYAAACDGYFFAPFKDLHPKKEFPRLSLLVLGAVTVVACWFSFDNVLTALLTSRIIAQFLAQVAAVIAVRRLRPDVALPFRMWLYPAPCLIALVGWTIVYIGQAKYGWGPVYYGLGTLALGGFAFLIFSRRRPG